MNQSVESTLRLLLGSTSARVISFLLIPILARIYAPEDYGVFGLTLSVVGLAVIAFSLQLQHAIVLQVSNGAAIRLGKIVVMGSVVGGIVVSFSTYLYLIYRAPQFESTGAFSIVSGLVVIVSGILGAFRSLGVRAKAFETIGYSVAVTAIAVGVFQIALGLFGFGHVGLILGYLVGQMTASLILFWSVGNIRVLVRNRTSGISFRTLLRKNRDFCYFGMPQEILSSASQSAPILVLGAFFGLEAAGIYAFAARVLLAPTALLSAAMRDVIYQRYANLLKSPIELKSEYVRLTAIAVIGGLVIASLVSGFLPEIFDIAFGADWRSAGSYASWLIFWIVLIIANVPASVIFKVLRRQRQSLVLSVGIFISRISALLIAGAALDDVATVAIYSVVAAVWSLIFVATAWRLVAKL